MLIEIPIYNISKYTVCFIISINIIFQKEKLEGSNVWKTEEKIGGGGKDSDIWTQFWKS